ncbi:MAG: PAS domain S-box protein, partial [Gammaproteobacteria bacterium]
MAIQIFLTPVLFYGILYFIERGFQSQFIDQVRNNTYLYAAAMHPSVGEENIPKQISFLYEALFNEDLILAEFIHPDGSVTGPDSDARIADTSFKEDFKFDENGDQVYYIALPLLDDVEGDVLGTIRLGYNEIPTQKRIYVAYRYGALLAVGYAVLSISMAIFLGRRLIRPISQLQDMAQSIATGNTAAGLNVNTDILEISALAKDLDSMRRTLVDQHRDVKDREKRLYAILDNAGEGIISIDTTGVIRSFNQAAESIFGYTARQVVGRNVSALIPLPDRKHHDDYIKRYLATGEAKVIGISQRLQAQHKDGHVFPVYLTVTEIELGLDHTFIGIFRDLTKEEEKERQLLQFWRAVEQSPVSIIITDVNGIIEYVNPHFCQVTGYRSEEVIGRNPRILKSGNTHSDAYRQLWLTISNGD